MGRLLQNVFNASAQAQYFRLFGPDETASS